MERLQKVIANSGYCSRRKAEDLIRDGKVKVNGEVASIGLSVKDNAIIEVEGHILEKEEMKYYVLLNKPRGVVTTVSDPEGRKTVIDIIGAKKRIYPVGRLDYDTTGAILLTNDGELTNKLTHPKNEIEKVYIAKIKGVVDGASIMKLRNGIKIDDFKTAPARVKLKSYSKMNNTSLVEITIHEGHNHQVKKMFEAVGYDVIGLTRIRFAFLEIKDLKSGEFRSLTPQEVKRLYSL